MILNGIRFQDGGVVLDGYPAGSTAHGIEGEHAHELRRLAVFMSDLRQAQECLALIPVGPPEQSSAPLVLCEALADAALLAFCRCFDKDHPLKPLEPAQVLALTQRSETERLRLVRNKVVAHDDRLFCGVFSLVVQNSDKICIEAVSMNLRTPFCALAELDTLRALCPIVFEWIVKEHERVASEIVKAHNAMPLAERTAAPPFNIEVKPKDHFAPQVKPQRKC